MQSRRLVDRKRRQRREDDPGGAEHDRQDAGLDGADADRPGRLVAGAADRS
jgi:hypothetical protein